MKKPSSLMLLFFLLLSTQLAFSPAIALSSQIHASPLSNKVFSSQAPVQGSDIRWGVNRRVTDGSSPYPEQVEPTLTILSSGRLLVGWKEADTYNGPGRRVGFCYSDDEGDTFSQNILMEPVSPNEFQSDPWLVSDSNDNAYFTFLEYGGSGEGMGVAKTTDGGDTWQSPTQASDTVGYLDDKETVCVDEVGNIYLMWDHFVTDSQADLVFTKSTDNGASFQPTQILGPWETHGGIPYLTCTPNGTLFVSTIWDSVPDGPINTIFFMKSTDLGTTWTLPQQVNPPSSGEISIITVCATDSNHHIYICFAAGSPINKEVFVTKSIDGGSTWSAPVQVNDVTTNMQRMVEMHIDDDDDIHVAWLDAQNDEWDIYYSYSDDGGTSFSSDVRITTEGFPLSFTRPGDYITLRSGPDGKLFIVWTDGRVLTDQDIYLAKQDVATPSVIAAPIAPPAILQPVTFTVEATDDDHVALVELNYQIDQGSYRKVPMVDVGEDVYQVTIPGGSVLGSALTYFFVVNDSAGRSTRLPTASSEYFTVPISSLSPTLIITIVAAVVIIIIVIVMAVWYLRKP